MKMLTYFTVACDMSIYIQLYLLRHFCVVKIISIYFNYTFFTSVTQFTMKSDIIYFITIFIYVNFTSMSSISGCIIISQQILYY